MKSIFNLKGDNIFVEVKTKEYVWGDNRKDEKVDARAKIKQRLRELRDIRSGKHHREMRVMKKSVDKDNEKKIDKTRQEIDREKLDKKFSEKSKEKLN